MKEKQDRLVALIIQLEDRERVLAAEQDAVKAREVLMLSHPPFTCPSSPSTAVSSVNRQCPTIRLTSHQCTLSPFPQNRLCPLHIATHTTISSVLRLETQVLEKARAEASRIEVGKGDVSSNIAIVRDYVRHLEEAMDSRKRHQKTYSCNSELRPTRPRSLVTILMSAMRTHSTARAHGAPRRLVKEVDERGPPARRAERSEGQHHHGYEAGASRALGG